MPQLEAMERGAEASRAFSVPARVARRGACNSQSGPGGSRFKLFGAVNSILNETEGISNIIMRDYDYNAIGSSSGLVQA